MKRLPLLVLVAALVAAALVIVATSDGLPERVATHFGPSGAPDDWASRGAYLATTLALAVVLPLVVVGLVALLTRHAPHYLSMPNRDFWFEPARRARTQDAVFVFGCALGGLLALFVTAMHLATVHANALAVPRLDESLLYVLLGAFGAGIATWTMAFYARFRIG